MIRRNGFAVSPKLTKDDTVFNQGAILEIGIDALFYGFHAALFVAAMAALARQKHRSRLVTAVVISLFISSTVEVVLGNIFYLIQAPLLSISERIGRILLALDVTVQICIRFNLLVCDAIVVWRAWALWQDNRVAKIILSLCMASSVVGVLAHLIWYALAYLDDTAPILSLLMVTIPLLLTNLVATILVGLQVWYYRRNIRSVASPWRKKTRVEKVLVLLLESGFVYSLLWIVSLALEVDGSSDETRAAYYMAASNAYQSFAGIYPTLIVIIVAVQRSTTESLVLSTQVSHPMEFANTNERTENPTSGATLRTSAGERGSE
ncbi:uncharacterized protein SCHCODRAFT_02634777 [Schizophyllum commune H4-8]|uniref:uncharacterized protein n=1 Tax=Schizophyllum commune (strain H4-8 / FGSC 9210) TaxID=578458 RepID=UPI00215EACFB|nr:uncharacterized protein SCHCODRAFT_02634777 [Schizophyllum commune H4-8]KAI5889517.1 hypothetical protein SCHCODRAFT_02634777 [Schizophyllum commune H4-8]